MKLAFGLIRRWNNSPTNYSSPCLFHASYRNPYTHEYVILCRNTRLFSSNWSHTSRIAIHIAQRLDKHCHNKGFEESLSRTDEESCCIRLSFHTCYYDAWSCYTLGTFCLLLLMMSWSIVSFVRIQVCKKCNLIFLEFTIGFQDIWKGPQTLYRSSDSKN